MSRHNNLTSLFTDVADAMRDKFGLTGQLKADDFDTTIGNLPVYNGEIYVPPLPIGGRIFYVDDTASGATYTFYDANGNVLPTQTVAGLANAVGYTVSGTPSKDKFYVYDNTSHTTGGITVNNGLAGKDSMYWEENMTWEEIGITSNGIGKGKTNTATALAYKTWDSHDIFYYVKACNDSNLNGCNDWFIASKAEQDKLRESGLVTWYNSVVLWSSVEDDFGVAYVWGYVGGGWGGSRKRSNRSCFAARAF